MIKEKIIKTLDTLIEKGIELATNMEQNPYDSDGSLNRSASAFRAECMEAIKKIDGSNSEYYKGFERIVRLNNLSILRGVELLKSFKNTANDGLIDNLKSLVSQEVFKEITGTAEYMLQNGLKDFPAINIGILLEQRIKSLCKKNGIATENLDANGKLNPIHTEVLSAELVKTGLYDKTVQKHITAWLGIRNSAAHGKHQEYKIEDVKLMLEGVKVFLDTYIA